MPKIIGSINCYVTCPCIVNGERAAFDGTLKGLVRLAVTRGAHPGDTIKADFGAGFENYKLYAAPHDDRAYGVWAERA